MTENEFRAAIVAAGIPIAPDERILADGALHRFACEGDSPGNKNGWYVLHGSNATPAGAFGCWKRGITGTWSSKRREDMSAQERAEYRKAIARMRAQRDADRQREHAEAAERAQAWWNESAPCVDHPYLRAKGIRAHGVKLYGERLIIPVRGPDRSLRGLQYIEPDGTKRYTAGTAKRGAYHAIGGRPAGVIGVAEGFATAASVYEASGIPVACAFDAGNLDPVARALREQHPRDVIVIFGDDDRATAGNPGRTKAEQAAQAVGGIAIFPPFEPGEAGTDWNDYTRAHGADATKAAIEPAIRDATRELRLRRAHLMCIGDIEPQPISWIWPGRIARGKITIIAGEPGLGKSLLTAAIASTVTVGGRWPVDRSRAELGSVIFLSAEDDVADTICPRLVAAGADRNRVHTHMALAGGDAPRVLRPPSLTESGLPELEKMLSVLDDCRLLVIDPVSAFLAKVDTHNNAEVRAALAPLSALAAKYGVAVLLVTHLNKGSGGSALARVTGSLAFVAAARSAFVVTRDQADPARRLILPLKNNLGPDSTGLAYRIMTAPNSAPRLEWESAPVTITAEEALAPIGPGDERSATVGAQDFLRSLLAGGTAIPAKQIKRDADGAGHAWRTVQLAASQLGVERKKLGVRAGWVWSLPSKAQGNAQGAKNRWQENIAPSGDLCAFGASVRPEPDPSAVEEGGL